MTNSMAFLLFTSLEYMLQKLCIEEAKVPELCVSLYKFYGTTLAGLRVWLSVLFFFLFFFFGVNIETSACWQSFVMVFFFFLIIGYRLSVWLWWLPQVCTLASSTFVYLRYKAPNLALSMFYSYVHGRLPYMMLKPDPVLRNLLLSLPIRKVVSVFSFCL